MGSENLVIELLMNMAYVFLIIISVPNQNLVFFVFCFSVKAL